MSTSPINLLVLSGNQLFPAERLPAPETTAVLMVEQQSECTRFAYHQQKLGFVLAAMREHAAYLRGSGYQVLYRKLPEPSEDDRPLGEHVLSAARELDARLVQAFPPPSRGQSRALEQALERSGRPIRWLVDPMFLTDTDELPQLMAGARPRMARFYSEQRRRLDVLMDGRRPLGDRWSFDKENRKALPARQSVPELPTVHHSALTTRTLQEVGQRFAEHPGDANSLWLPTSRDGALSWLERFVEERLIGFGTFEDALSNRTPALFHSVLAPFLNVGLLTPDQVLEAVLKGAAERSVPLNDLEGFVRQLVGWREFVRGVYLRHPDMRQKNCWGAQRSMAPTWFSGDTGIPPLDEAMSKLERYGWNHHIERLMVIANLQNLCEIHPADVYRFFMSRYIDAYDWVMVPNVFGMGLTSDGGTFATKPYVAASNYLCRMGRYKRGPWCDIVDGLYWRFVDRHRAVLERNPRTMLMVHGLDRLSSEHRSTILAAAESFLEAHTR